MIAVLVLLCLIVYIYIITYIHIYIHLPILSIWLLLLSSLTFSDLGRLELVWPKHQLGAMQTTHAYHNAAICTGSDGHFGMFAMEPYQQVSLARLMKDGLIVDSKCNVNAK